jgi:hypothetical protein
LRVLGAYIGALPVELYWIVRAKENLQNLPEMDYVGVEGDLCDFGVSCGAPVETCVYVELGTKPPAYPGSTFSNP